jgi:hypothetical protein
MRPESPLHSRHDVRAIRIALAASVVAGLVVIAACTDSSEKSITAPPALRNSSSSSGHEGSSDPLSNAGKVTLCVDPASPVGNYTFAYSDLNNQAGLQGNEIQDMGFWTDLGGDWHAFPPYGSGGPINLPDGSVTAFNPNTSGAVIANNGDATPDCVLALERVLGSQEFRDNLAAGKTAIDTWSGMTIAYVSNNAGANYVQTNCILDLGTIPPQRKFDPLPAAWSSATSYAVGAYVTTDANPGDATSGIRVWRALVANTNVTPAEGATWTNHALSDCGANNNPTRAFANYEHGVVVSFVFGTPQNGHNCTYTQGYYKNHESYTAGVLSGNAGTTYIDGTGKLIIGSYHLSAAQVDAILGAAVGHAYNAGGVTFTKDQLSMIHQLITAELNIAGGAAPATIAATITAANNYIGATKTQLSGWTTTLENFNKGSSGPAHCS